MYPFVLAVARRGDVALPSRIGAGGVRLRKKRIHLSLTFICNCDTLELTKETLSTAKEEEE